MTDMGDYEKYNCPDWDGYGAKPITAETLEIARALARLMQSPPDIAPGADGSIGFEWVGPMSRHKIFLDVSAAGLSIYARVGEKTLHQPRRPDSNKSRGEKP